MEPETEKPMIDLSLATLDELWEEITRRCEKAVLLMDTKSQKGFPEGCVKQRYHGGSYDTNALLLDAALNSFVRRAKFLVEDC